ncbi:FitA-like ribbon-helix-helix domain-containing protein [Microbacterium sp.]|uniref:FitA-like ribbon-helix-helix domain-containing protein n=1 Tax=Microbacterium sp. TaxID=51671 RepID=UPI00092765EF|nr:toxin-antitoxin system antitoxin subunit [Microbacterium sp.]MBN9185648.1 toxin-antitoxin system antitoxin subunit [Microbacterium sp.]MBN9192415.1 toxin-antitoxin system antitoxin subunit [Microbacterium sp.]OJU72228.1 MAG: hypothetical protein BGO04_02950 [Microbacterium sp. 70-38]
MGMLTVRSLDPVVQARLRERAARHGRSMEAEARAVIAAAVMREDEPIDLARRIRRHFADDPIELEMPDRTERQRPVELTA